MKSALIGIGQAGGKLTEQIIQFATDNEFGFLHDAVAINSAKADLDPLAIETILIGQDRVAGKGVGGDNELGAEIMEDSLEAVQQRLQNRITTQAESIMLLAGLGGGTGSGGTPVLARRLKELYRIPVYVLGILPGTQESNLAHVNAGRSLKTLSDIADATILIDNDAWKSTNETLTEGYETINRAIAKRLGLLLAAGEAGDTAAESVVDSSELINTLRSGGIAALGYGQVPVDDPTETTANTVMTATRSAVRSGLSLTGTATAEAALLVVAGQPAAISRKGVEKSRRFVEDETGSMQVRGGDFPLENEHIAALVVLSDIQNSDRIEGFMHRAEEAAAAPTETEDTSEKLFQNDELDGL